MSFEEAKTLFRDPWMLHRVDPRHTEETRFLALGVTSAGQLLSVVYTERRDRVRLISARRATKQEIQSYATRHS